MGHTAFRSTRLLERNQTDFVAINLRCDWSRGKSLFVRAGIGSDFSRRAVLRVPRLFNLKTDPYERAMMTSNTYWDWLLDHIWLFIPAQVFVGQMMQSLIEFPATQKPPSFSIDQMMEKLQAGATSA